MSWASIIASVLSIIRSVYEALLRMKDRELGHAEATADALTKQSEQNKIAEAERIAAAQAHHDHPNDFTGYDEGFRRSGE